MPNEMVPRLLNNSSEIVHSRIDLLDNQITINYDLSVPAMTTEDNKTLKPKKLKSKEKFAKKNNFQVLPQEKLDQEIEFDQSVDLEQTMWHVLRNKKSCNNILKRFETKGQCHYLSVNDIVKFGRVNFKVSAIKSEKLDSKI